ncbi:RHS repeat-associated core domain-containing protein [Amycolatopsis pretoriensis]|uniref:RHS repeat-associated core domain-containing protein n=1 Tax=Amycolatopsis pretoriensis TaxID=218821 RepID=A0A1H5Q453_9PSEU|nr:RHS repeat-associated core domain-containing protein [Amycolatopsis pretoriensis]SEF20674.1 RHS repeat-associated core domain-containing protein [Amycolatopsis pretoriensis]
MYTRRTSCHRPVLAVATALVLLSGGLLAVTTAEAGTAAVLTPTLGGPRPSATRIPFPISDTVSASVDVGTGNLLVTTSDLALPGIQGDLQLGLTYNSLRLGTGTALPSGAAGAGWAMRVGQDTKVILNSDNSVLYLAPESREGLFQPTGGTAYTAPAGFKVAMVKTTSGWTITDHDTNSVSAFDSTGQLVSIKDRNAQTTTFAYTSGKLSQVTSTRGGAGARTANLSWSGSLATIGQTGDDGTARSVTYTYTAGKLTKITDPTAKSTQFGYDANTGDLTTITNGAGKQTAIQYDTAHRVKKVTQENPAGGATTRFTYYSAGETLVASPNNTQAIPADGPQTDYFLNAQELVTSVADPLGRGRAKTYTPFTDIATSTSGTGGVTIFGHDPAVNAGESLTSVTAPTGAKATATYANTGTAKYLPSGGTDWQGNAKLFTYDGAGNQLASANTTATATSKVGYNPDGTLDTATDPRTNVTDYSANTDHQVTDVAPPAGSSLAATTLSYDGFGRLHAVRDGRGLRTIYAYDRADRIKTIQYSDGTPDVAFTYDGAGNVLTRTDTSGTTTLAYDAQNRITSRTATSGGGTLTYGYDKTGNLISKTDARGATTYGYDAANEVTDMTTPNGQKTAFAYDDDGKRTDTWFTTNPAHTTFAAHTKTTFDKAGRISRTWTSRASNDATKTFDTGFCYSPRVAGQACPSTSATTDTDLIKWSTDNLTGAVSLYSYDTSNRLTAISNHGGHDYAYTYDKAGNRLTAKVDGTTTQTLTYNTGNQISNTGYSHDAAGNRTADPAQGTFTYNAAGQTTTRTQGSSSSTYTWAGGDQNELVSTTTGATTTSYVYGLGDANGVPVLQSFARNGQTAYIDTDPTGVPLVFQRPDGTTHYYALDNQSSPVNLIDSTGTVTATYSYDPAGRQLTAAGAASAANPIRYTQGLLDETTGWLRHGVRWHDPATGNWTALDPISLVLEPDMASRYAYVGGNPVNRIDPTGLKADTSKACLGGAAGSAIAALAGAASAPAIIPAAALGCIGGVVTSWIVNGPGD